MIIPQEAKENQVSNRKTRRERRPEAIAEKKRIRKIERAARKVAMPVDFDNTTITGFGNLQFLEQFKLAIGFKGLLSEKISLAKANNSVYSIPELLDWHTDALAVGISRFDHLESLKNDPGYLALKELDRFPDESTFRGVYNLADEDTLKELEEILVALLHKRAELEGPKSVWIDIDDTVITLFGEQENGAIGYNPRYKGRKSYMLRVATIHSTREVIAVKLYDGKASGQEMGDFLDVVNKNLPKNYVLEGIRADSGFFSESNIEWIEEQEADYFIKVKKNTTIKNVIEFINDEKFWEEIDDTYSITELRFPLKTWKYARRFIFIREKLPPKDANQLELFDSYKFQVIVTKSELPAIDVWRNYNQRCDVENCIKELRYGFGIKEASQNLFLKNACFAVCKAIAYNLILWFKSTVFPEEIQSYQVATIRRLILNVPGNIVNIGGGYRRIRLAPNEWLEKVVRIIQKNMELFFQALFQRANAKAA